MHTHTHTKIHKPKKSQMYFCMHVGMNTEWSDVCSWQRRKVPVALEHKRENKILTNQAESVSSSFTILKVLV